MDIGARHAELLGSRIGRIDGDVGGDTPRARRHDDDAASEKDRLEDAVRDEDRGEFGGEPKAEQIAFELRARDFVQRRERLVHEQQPRLGRERAGDGGAHAHAAG